MQVGIVGLPRSGKTTIFNAVTRGTAEVAAYASAQGKPNIGVAKVPDARLDRLEEIFKPKRKVPAEVSYTDIPVMPEGFGASRGIASEMLNHLQGTDALLLVARSFEDPSVTHVYQGIDAFRDVETMLYELVFADLQILERRLTRLEESFKGAKAPEREALTKEQSLLARLKADLEAGTALRDQSLSTDESRALEGFQLLTAKPLLVVVNVGESELSGVPSVEARLAPAFDGPRVRTAALCGTLEMELAQMESAEEREYRESLGAGDSGLERTIGLSYDAADLTTFFTGNPNEVRAWAVTRGDTALKAAGRIHSDFERGFIRAEVVTFENLAEAGSVAEARRRGVLRQEGKTYVVQDGDVINVLFNV